MENLIAKITEINSAVNGFAWGPIMLVLLVGSGVYLTARTGFIQVRQFIYILKNTIGSLFRKGGDKDHGNNLSPFQAVTTALAGTVGTGNIAGVTGAIFVGGPGAVFWMWIAAFFGMMTNFSENLLGIYYRRKNSDGEWSGGPMYYLREGLGKRYGVKWLSPVSKVLAVLFSCFAILASFGIGNMAQVNKIVLNVDAAFFANGGATTIPGTEINIVHLIIGIVLLIIEIGRAHV